MKVTVLAAALLALASPVLAQEASPPPAVIYNQPEPRLDPERVALAHQMLELVDAKSMMRSMFDSMSASMRPPATATADQKARIAQLLHSLSASMEATAPQLMDSMAVVYAREFTAQEMKDTIAFYGSPSGQKILHKLPALMQSVVPAAMQMMPGVIVRTEQDYCAHRTCDAHDRQMFTAMKRVYAARGAS